MKILKVLAAVSFCMCSSAFAKNEAIVLMYHRIAEWKNDMNTTPENFSSQMSYLKNNNFNVISSSVLVEAIKNKKQLPPKSIVITFDDGWATQKTAMKILSSYHYPATFALVTEYQVYRNKTYLQKADLDEFKGQNFTYVNHSRTHFTKDYLGNPEKDVLQSKADMIKLTGDFIPIYVYPYGKKSKKLVSVLQKDGYEAAFGVNGQPVNVDNANIFNINRFLMNDSVSIEQFAKIVNKVS